MELDTLLKQVYFGNSLQDYAWFLGMIILGFILKKLISKYLSHMLFRLIGKKSTVGVERFDALLTQPIGLFIMLSIVYIEVHTSNFPINGI